MRTPVMLTCCALLLCVGHHALAQQPAPSDPAARAFAKGTELFEKRDYLGARESFEEAYRLKPHYLVQCNIARCHEWSNDMVKAREHYQRCLSEGAEKAAVAQAVRDSLAAVEKRITYVEVTSPGAGGTVHVDGRVAGPAPSQVPLNPGTHVLEVRRAGASPASLTITTRGGERKTVSLVPVDLVDQPKSQPVVVKKSRRTLRQPWFWIAAGATVAFAVTAAGLGAATVKARDTYLESKTEDDYDKAVSQRMLTNVFWGLTAAAGATATTLFFFTDFSRRATPERDTEVSFSVGVRGRF